MTLLRTFLAFIVLVCAGSSLRAAAPEVATAEYYIDSDPGPGNGTPIPGIVPGDAVQVALDIPATRVAALPLGIHFLTVRFRNAESDWSVAFSRVFERVGPTMSDDVRLAGAEYYLDADPGPGNGIPINGIFGATDAGMAVEIPASAVATMTPGIHFLTARFRNADGNWSVAFSRVFDKDDRAFEPPILLGAVEFRWFLDDQTVGQPLLFTAQPPSSSIAIRSVASVAGLSEGRTFRLVATPLDVDGNRGAPASVSVRVAITDNDGDGLTDSWEVANGLNPTLAADAAQDSDGDGLTNLEEFTRGTHPRRRDTSGDGIDDGLAVALRLDPLQSYPSVATTLGRLAEGQVRALYPGKPVLTRDGQSGLFRLRLGLQDTGDLATWQKLPIGVGEAVVDNGDLILSFRGTEPNRFYRIDAGE